MKKFLLVIGVLFTVIIFQQSCTKIDTTTLGADLIPGVDNVNTFDTLLDVVTNNFLYPDTTIVKFNEYQAFGNMVDPEFGTTQADIYSSFYPSSFGVYPFGAKDSIINQAIDSVVLSLSYKQLYGDSLSKQNINVYEISKAANFIDTVNYKINTTPFPTLGLVGSKNNYDFSKLNDSDSLEYPLNTKTAISNVLRIKLDNSFGNRFINYTTGNAYKNDSIYQTDYFKGLAIKSDVGSVSKNALAYFDLTASKLIFYYRKKNGTAVIDTTTTAFGIYTISTVHDTTTVSKIAATANLIKRNIVGTNYANNLANTATNKPFLYIQSSPGSYASIHIKGLQNLSNRVVHRAELVFEKVPSQQDTVFTVPTNMYIDAVDSTDPANIRFTMVPNEIVYDFNTLLTNIGAVGGGINSKGQYVYNLTRYVQGIVTRKEKSYGLRIYSPYKTSNYISTTATSPIEFKIATPVSAGRLVLRGAGNTTKKLQMRIIYSKL